MCRTGGVRRPVGHLRQRAEHAIFSVAEVGHDVGATGVFYADGRGGALHFTRSGDKFVDTFWFAWSTYWPDTALIQ